MLVQELSVESFINLPDWKERMLRCVEIGGDPFNVVVTDYPENPLDDWNDISIETLTTADENLQRIPPDELREVTIYLLENASHDALGIFGTSHHKEGMRLLWWLYKVFGADREILEKWIDRLGDQAEKELGYGSANSTHEIWHEESDNRDTKAIADLIELFPDRINWEKVLTKAISDLESEYALNHDSGRNKLKSIPELLNIVYTKNPSFHIGGWLSR